MLHKRRRETEKGKKKKSQKLLKKKQQNYRYKMDNKYQKAKIKNLELKLCFLRLPYYTEAYGIF